eukprot:TRINITY_DN19351_c0_g1_i1.p1 TRINITY_DN19351_c0_g1~~TRINITY_DN19351_c0_g1_i1.p1  ORF type:complete len:389 (-),score=99.16 TRINITY_DN19351_c0_g1_i1:15-1181(-)
MNSSRLGGYACQPYRRARRPRAHQQNLAAMVLREALLQHNAPLAADTLAALLRSLSLSLTPTVAISLCAPILEQCIDHVSTPMIFQCHELFSSLLFAEESVTLLFARLLCKKGEVWDAKNMLHGKLRENESVASAELYGHCGLASYWLAAQLHTQRLDVTSLAPHESPFQTLALSSLRPDCPEEKLAEREELLQEAGAFLSQALVQSNYNIQCHRFVLPLIVVYKALRMKSEARMVARTYAQKNRASVGAAVVFVQFLRHLGTRADREELLSQATNLLMLDPCSEVGVSAVVHLHLKRAVSEQCAVALLADLCAHPEYMHPRLRAEKEAIRLRQLVRKVRDEPDAVISDGRESASTASSGSAFSSAAESEESVAGSVRGDDSSESGVD